MKVSTLAGTGIGVYATVASRSDRIDSMFSSVTMIADVPTGFSVSTTYLLSGESRHMASWLKYLPYQGNVNPAVSPRQGTAPNIDGT
jgi:hypothetical protein